MCLTFVVPSCQPFFSLQFSVLEEYKILKIQSVSYRKNSNVKVMSQDATCRIQNYCFRFLLPINSKAYLTSFDGVAFDKLYRMMQPLGFFENTFNI